MYGECMQIEIEAPATEAYDEYESPVETEHSNGSGTYGQCAIIDLEYPAAE